MKVNLHSLSKFSQPEKYNKVMDMIDRSRKILEDNKAKYSEKEDYDKIVKLNEENKILVENFRIFLSNKELLMEDMLESIKKHQESFIKNSNIKELSKMLGVDSNFGEENSSNIRNINEIYAKVQENSNIIIIYDIERKKFNQIKDETHFFHAKCMSYYIHDIKTIYVSGGMKSFNRHKNYSTDFYKIKIKINFDDFEFEYNDLASMNEGRASHSMIKYQDYLMAIGGVNTKTCEIFDIKKNKWGNLPDLPNILANPALAIVNNCLYVFSGSGSLTTFDGIFKLSLNNLSRVIQNEKGFENILEWEKLDYSFRMLNNERAVRLRRGMAALPIGDTILLFGGFDYDNIYDDIYIFNVNKELNKQIPEANINNSNDKENSQVNIKLDQNKKNIDPPEKKILEKVKYHSDEEDEIEVDDNNIEFERISIDEDYYKIMDSEVQLPIKTFFNSNLLLFDYYLIMIDGYNNALEYNLKTQEFYYYT
jgi:hypothetical protein